MRLSSPTFTDGESIPEKHGYDTENTNPPLRIEDVPASAASLALVVDDPDAQEPAGKIWDHWVVWNVVPDIARIETGSTPPGATEGEMTSARSVMAVQTRRIKNTSTTFGSMRSIPSLISMRERRRRNSTRRWRHRSSTRPSCEAHTRRTDRIDRSDAYPAYAAAAGCGERGNN